MSWEAWFYVFEQKVSPAVTVVLDGNGYCVLALGCPAVLGTEPV